MKFRRQGQLNHGENHAFGNARSFEVGQRFRIDREIVIHTLHERNQRAVAQSASDQLDHIPVCQDAGSCRTNRAGFAGHVPQMRCVLGPPDHAAYGSYGEHQTADGGEAQGGASDRAGGAQAQCPAVAVITYEGE